MVGIIQPTPKIICFPSYDEIKMLNNMALLANIYIKKDGNTIKAKDHKLLKEKVDKMSSYAIDEMLDFGKEWKDRLIYAGKRDDEIVDAVTSIAFARKLGLNS